MVDVEPIDAIQKKEIFSINYMIVRKIEMPQHDTTPNPLKNGMKQI